MLCFVDGSLVISGSSSIQSRIWIGTFPWRDNGGWHLKNYKIRTSNDGQDLDDIAKEICIELSMTNCRMNIFLLLLYVDY